MIKNDNNLQSIRINGVVDDFRQCLELLENELDNCEGFQFKIASVAYDPKGRLL